MNPLGELLRQEKAIYLDRCKEEGGTADGFRQHILQARNQDRLRFDARATEALMEAATRAWQSPPRRHGPDLFSINGIEIQSHLTRPSADYVTGKEIEDDDEIHFEKVASKYATIQDGLDDALITQRKGNQTIAAAEKKMQMVDEARRRAKGDMSIHLRDVAD